MQPAFSMQPPLQSSEDADCSTKSFVILTAFRQPESLVSTPPCRLALRSPVSCPSNCRDFCSHSASLSAILESTAAQYEEFCHNVAQLHRLGTMADRPETASLGQQAELNKSQRYFAWFIAKKKTLNTPEYVHMTHHCTWNKFRTLLLYPNPMCTSIANH